jgi:hypothetical protein
VGGLWYWCPEVLKKQEEEEEEEEVVEMAMASQEGGPPAKTQAEVRLQQLLEKQLSTTGR